MRRRAPTSRIAKCEQQRHRDTVDRSELCEVDLDGAYVVLRRVDRGSATAHAGIVRANVTDDFDTSISGRA